MTTTKEEATQFLTKVWHSGWASDLSILAELYNPDAVLCAFSPPKQETWTGLEAITAHLKSIQPIVSSKSFTITNLAYLVQDKDAFYATFEDVFEVHIPGQEGSMKQSGLMHVVREGGKVKAWTIYEDPTPFVEMAMKGAFNGPPA